MPDCARLWITRRLALAGYGVREGQPDLEDRALPELAADANLATVGLLGCRQGDVGVSDDRIEARLVVGVEPGRRNRPFHTPAHGLHDQRGLARLGGLGDVDLLAVERAAPQWIGLVDAVDTTIR